MTVRELRKALEAYPEDAQVFLYSELDECDGLIDKITVDTAVAEFDDTTEETFYYTPHYCQGDSEASEYWHAVGFDRPIVFLHSTNLCYDYTSPQFKNPD